jgi:formylglycine-generating enzyme required for sulfatase activity
MHGNVLEWVEDRWHNSYERAPIDGKAWLDGDARPRVVRGGSWNDNPRRLRAAYRNAYAYNFRLYFVGFRLARTLNP